jgi:hypothetical protein
MKRLRLRLLLLLLAATIAAWASTLWVERSYREAEPHPYDLIEEGLYVGRYVPEPPPGTDAVLNLCPGQDMYEVEVSLWEPIRDGPPAPSLEWLRRMVEFIDTQRQAERTVYVHCAAGVSRSGMVSTAYLMYEHNWTRDQALEFVQSKRPIVLPNPAFMQLLSEWEQSLKERAAAEEGQR